MCKSQKVLGNPELYTTKSFRRLKSPNSSIRETALKIIHTDVSARQEVVSAVGKRQNFVKWRTATATALLVHLQSSWFSYAATANVISPCELQQQLYTLVGLFL